MLTFFTVPKPFRGHIGIIQRNAIRSWTRLRPECDILLCGDDEGTAQVAAELGVRHIPEIARNDIGSPLLDAVFAAAQEACRHTTLAYVNADIILLSDFLPAIQSVGKKGPFLVLGERWDLDVDEAIDFARPEWEAELRDRIAKHGSLHGYKGVDYYVFSRHLWPRIPPFVIGRKYYDRWLIAQARVLGARVIDATERVTCVHQNHERTYATVGLEGPEGETNLRSGRESRRNRKLAGGKPYLFSVRDSNWVFDEHGLRRAPWSLERTRRYLRALPFLHPAVWRRFDRAYWGQR
ncbi:MAG: hypothetical protein JRG76_16590 [Deltaproteobacteria bacterium]|nr:hypothetical protein [Deltaproteobacteria bacterium]